MFSGTNEKSTQARAKRLRVCLQASALAAGCMTTAAPAVARSAFDGDWSVVITTSGGGCPSGLRYGVQISNGAVSSPASGEAQVRGRVSPKGAVTVTVQAGGQWARGSGRLDLGRGGGVWRGQGTAGSCQGSWAAARSGSSSVQARGPGGPIYNYAPQGYQRRPY
jgi:hypothetical protein